MPSVKNPHFFCETCGAEVPLDAKSCPRCGQLFVSVRCPGCGFSGEEALFKNGCPACGYSAAGRNRGVSTPRKEKPIRPAGPLPFWVYALAVAAFASVAAALALRLFSS